MGLFEKKGTIEERNFSTSIEHQLSAYNLIDFNERNVLTIPVVAESIQVLAGSIASMPLYLYQEDKNHRVNRINHYLEFLLNESSNDFETGYTFKTNMVTDLLLYGKSYFYLEKNGRKLDSLHHIPYKTVIEKNHINDRGIIKAKTIHYTLNERTFEDDATNFLIIDTGKSGVLNSRNVLELFLKHNQIVKSSFDNSSLPFGVLKAKGRMTKDAIDKLRASWASLYTGTRNAGKTVILEEGLEYESLTPNYECLHLNETKKSFVEDVERLFNLYNVKGNDELFLKRTLAPIINCIESALSKYLLLENEQRKNIYIRFSTQELLRPSSETQYNMMGSAVSNGLITLEEARSFLDLPAFFTDESHDKILISLGKVLVDRDSNITIPNMASKIDNNSSIQSSSNTSGFDDFSANGLLVEA